MAEVAGKILKAALPPALDHGMSQCMILIIAASVSPLSSKNANK